MFYLLTLPFRLFFCLLFGLIFLPFAILFLPFLILKLILKATFALFMLPIAIVTGFLGIAIALVAVAFALLIPWRRSSSSASACGCSRETLGLPPQSKVDDPLQHRFVAQPDFLG